MLCAVGKKVEDYWDASKKLLGDANKFLDNLLTFDKENIPDTIIKKIEPFIANDSFTPEAVAKVSKACTSICMWVRAMHLYHTASLSVSGATVAGALGHTARGKQRKDGSCGFVPVTPTCQRILRLAMRVYARRLLPSVQPWLPPKSLLTRHWVSLQVRRPVWLLSRRKSSPWRLSTRRQPPKRPRLQHR